MLLLIYKQITVWKLKTHNSTIGHHAELRISQLFTIQINQLQSLELLKENKEMSFNKMLNLQRIFNLILFNFSFLKLQKLYKINNLPKNPLSNILHTFIKYNTKIYESNLLIKFSNENEKLIQLFWEVYNKSIKATREDKIKKWYLNTSKSLYLDITTLYNTIIGSGLFSEKTAIKIYMKVKNKCDDKMFKGKRVIYWVKYNITSNRIKKPIKTPHKCYL